MRSVRGVYSSPCPFSSCTLTTRVCWLSPCPHITDTTSNEYLGEQLPVPPHTVIYPMRSSANHTAGPCERPAHKPPVRAADDAGVCCGCERLFGGH